MTCECNTSVNFSETVPLNQLLRHVLPLIPKVPPTMALDILRQKYINFARRTRILCSVLEQDKQAGVCDYQLIAPDDYQVYSILRLANRVRSVDHWSSNSFTNMRQDFDVLDNNIIVLNTVPSVDEVKGLRVWVTLIPKACISTMPASIADPFGYDIAKGVVGELLHIPNKEWTNDGLARRFELAYEKMLLSARALAVSNRKVDNNMAKPVRIL